MHSQPTVRTPTHNPIWNMACSQASSQPHSNSSIRMSFLESPLTTTGYQSELRERAQTKSWFGYGWRANYTPQIWVFSVCIVYSLRVYSNRTNWACELHFEFARLSLSLSLCFVHRVSSRIVFYCKTHVIQIAPTSDRQKRSTKALEPSKFQFALQGEEEILTESESNEVWGSICCCS